MHQIHLRNCFNPLTDLFDLCALWVILRCPMAWRTPQRCGVKRPALPGSSGRTGTCDTSGQTHIPIHLGKERLLPRFALYLLDNSSATWHFQANSILLIKISHFSLVAKMHDLIAWPFSANTHSWDELGPTEITALVSSAMNFFFFVIQLLPGFILQSPPAIIPPERLICFKFKFTRSLRALMVPYLLSEDQRLSLLFLVFYICEGWHNVSNGQYFFPPKNAAWGCLHFQALISP